MKCSAVLLTLTSALFACSCGASSKTLNTAKVERAIANSIVKERGLDSPSGVQRASRSRRAMSLCAPRASMRGPIRSP